MTNKKIALVLVSLLTLFLTACTQKANDPKQDNWDKYQEQGSITIGFDNTFVPMGFEEKNGQYTGFDIDLAQAVSEKLGFKIQFQPIDWDMKDKTLGAQAGSSGYLEFEAQPDLLKNRVKDQKANQYQSFNEALIDLKNDRIDALLIDRVYANYYLQSEGILNDYNVFSAGFESESFAVGVRPADKILLQALNQAFVELHQEGKFQEISQKWFGEDVATKEVKSRD